MAFNLHHLHQTKNKRKKKKSATADKLIYVAVIFGPIMTLPQIYDIWILGKNEVSIISWSGYAIIGMVWLTYGLKHQLKPIILVNSAWIVLDLAIVAGILIS